MNIVTALKKTKNDLFNLIVDGLNSKASINHIHSYNDLTDLPIGGGYTNEEIDSLIDAKIDVAIENLYPFEELNAPVIYHITDGVTGSITLRAEFEDGVVPESAKTFSVIMTLPDEKEQTVRLTEQYPEAKYIKLSLGNYHIEAITDNIQAEGYSLEIKYAVQFEDEQPVESQDLILHNTHTNATVIITYCYKNLANQ